MRNCAPVVMLVYNRPDHTKTVLEALDQNTLAGETDLFIYADAPKNDNAREMCQKVIEVVEEFAKNSSFKSVNLRRGEFNRGAGKNIIHGITEVINEYGRAIEVEDDIVCRKNFLAYMNDALDYYEKNPRIFSIGGHTKEFPELEQYKNDVYFAYRSCSWGWGIWKDRWDMIDWEVKDYPALKYNPIKRMKFARGGTDLYQMLVNEMEGKTNASDIRLEYSMSMHDMLAVYPKHTFVYNIGFDGTGVHCATGENEQYNDLEPVKYSFTDEVVVDRNLNAAFLREEYPSFWKRVQRKLRKLVQK